jgi:hypothetical protein
MWNYIPVQSLTEHLLEQGLADRVLSERQLDRAVGGPAARRYGLVNRALKAHELIRIRRGLYVLEPRYRTEAPHPFAIAQALAPGSYVSFETALAHHGWIPEATRVTANVVPGRKSSAYEHGTLGSFTFHPLALDPERFLELIEREQLAAQTALIAHPIRALMDLVCLRKLSWQGLRWLTQGMRIDLENLRSVTHEQIDILTGVYKQKRPRQFLSAFANELPRD